MKKENLMGFKERQAQREKWNSQLYSLRQNRQTSIEANKQRQFETNPRCKNIIVTPAKTDPKLR
jgi:hypothetical protein